MHDEPGDDHQGEEDVERNGNGDVWNADLAEDNGPHSLPSVTLGDDYQEAHRYIDDVSPDRYCLFVENSNAYPKRQGT